MREKIVVEVNGQLMEFSSLSKILWPAASYSKADLLDYHVRMQGYTLPHWTNRCLTLTRYPQGIEGDFFFQKNIPQSAPDWVASFNAEKTEYVVVDNFRTIAWLVNLGSVEFHPSTYQITDSDVPSYCILDLDPTAPFGFKETVEAAYHCRDLLLELGLRGYPKLSGATGIHIYIPLKPCYDFSVTSRLAQLVGETLLRAYPERITLERLIKKRRGIYVDYLQNHPGKTIVGVYSPRPTPLATVSTPVNWDDLRYYNPQDFTLKTVPEWVAERGDLFAEVLHGEQTLEHLTHYFAVVKA